MSTSQARVADPPPTVSCHHGAVADHEEPRGPAIEMVRVTDPLEAGPAWDEETRPLSQSEEFQPHQVELDHLPVGTRLGRYCVIEPIGEGGMGVVYKAFDPQLDRAVALKVLRKEKVGRSSGARELLVEAQTLAKIEHPNIVTIYDVGATDERVFIAMALCEGQTLRHHLLESEHDAREILSLFVAAGRGLAAAHRAGVVHRDFKPSNVLLDKDGLVRVADFGMARLMEIAFDQRSGPMTLQDEDQSTDDHERSVSTIVGTPLYMAPEQLLGRLGDHRMDQFSFCLCLYTALLGQPPFMGTSFQERRLIVPLGLGDAERDRLNQARHIPAKVRRALLRGLSVEPADRFATMDDLLSQLEPPRRWSWAAVAIGLSLGIGVGVAGGVLGGASQDEPCRDSAEQFGEAWSSQRAERLESHLEGIGHPSPAEQTKRVDRQLQAYARDWQASHADTCAATRVTQVQSDSLFDRRMLCLQRRRSRLATTGDLLLDAPDLATLNQRMPAAFTLPAIDDCNDVEALMREVPLPSDPKQLDEIRALYEQIDLADTNREAGALEDGLALAEQLVPQARQLGYAPVLAQALQALGRLQTDTSPARAERTIREAIEVASRGRDPLRVALAWPSLLYALTLQGKSAEGEQLEFAARAAIDFADDPKARAWLHNDLGTLYAEMSHTVEAIDHLERSLELKIMLDGDKHYDVGITRNNLGFALAFDDQWPQARLAFELARDNFAANVGPEHPMVGITLSGLCQVELGAKNYELALSRCAEARLLMRGPSLSAELLQRVDYLTARALWGLGRRYDAIEWARATIRNAGTTDSPIIGTIHRWLSKPERDLGAPLADTLTAKPEPAQLEPGPSKP